MGSITFSETFDELYRSMLSSNTMVFPGDPEQVVLVGSKIARS